MSQSASVFCLKVQRVEQVCLFELSWGQGLQLSVTLPYPETLDMLYQEWRADYLGFYQTALRGGVTETENSAIAKPPPVDWQANFDTALRGRVVNNGTISAPPIDWHARLVQTEAKLLYEFHQWLRQVKLFDIRSRLAQAVRDVEQGGEGEKEGTSAYVEVFLTCTPLDLARLPWEAWEIGTEFGAAGKIRFFRTSPNRAQAMVTPRHRRRRARILAILGDDTGLDFEAEKEALRSLSKIADIEFVGWQPGRDIGELKAQIIEAIADARGWDVLLFAGHSNEKDLVGGELGIAPGVSLLLSELEQPLLLAKQRGLQFALFNSCNGLTLANALISLGLSQVAVMREPVHNQVAQEFLVRFLQRLAEYEDVYEALQYASRYLKLEKHLTYPSGYLIPSLFRHPNAPLFRLKRPDSWFTRWIPTKKEAIALASLAFLSLQLPVQDFLIEQRVSVQARYRQLTNQVGKKTAQPPVLLVQIDEASIKRSKISHPKPMDRSYLADLVDKVSAMNAKVVGIDYLLDRYQKENDQKLSDSIRASVQKQGTWFVFGTKRNDNDGGWYELLPELVNPNWSLQGDTLVLYKEQVLLMSLVPRTSSTPQSLPFAYLLALAHQLNFTPASEPPQPQVQSSLNWLTQLKAHVSDTTGSDYKDIFSPSSRLQPFTNFAYHYGQRWLHPIIDFSIPPEQIYKRLPAWQLLAEPVESVKLDPHQQPVVIIAPGGYGEAGVAEESEDNFLVPAAVGYWRSQEKPLDQRQVFPGSEIHAYMVHHFLNQRFVVPIPDLWLLGVVALLGKGAALALEKVKGESKNEKGKFVLGLFPSTTGKWVVVMAGATAMYGLASLQLYIIAAVLLPYAIPTATFWTYILLNLLERKSHA